MHPPTCTTRRISISSTKIFSDIDTDNSGSVSLAELFEGLVAYPEIIAAIADANLLFDEGDGSDDEQQQRQRQQQQDLNETEKETKTTDRPMHSSFFSAQQAIRPPPSWQKFAKSEKVEKLERKAVRVASMGR